MKRFWRLVVQTARRGIKGKKNSADLAAPRESVVREFLENGALMHETADHVRRNPGNSFVREERADVCYRACRENRAAALEFVASHLTAAALRILP
ncbi:MAG: hypothetical protein ACRD7E_28220, partial [Bryobacteraceae bacterium]